MEGTYRHNIYVKIRRQEEFKLADEDELTVTWDGADHDGHRHHKTAEAGVRYTYTVRGVNKDSVLSLGYNKTGVSAAAK